LATEAKKNPLESQLRRASSFQETEDRIDGNTALVRRTLRSGQKVHFDGNVVVVGDVNPGAEIIATGHVIVVGALRGVVHAGATGDDRAAVLALKLRPTQLRIANHITRPPDGECDDSEQPEIAHIKDNVVTIEIYQSSIRYGNFKLVP